MLAFITSLKHPKTASSWDTVLSLLHQSLHSVCAQTSDDFRVFVVSNVPLPDIQPHPNVEVLLIDLPPITEGFSSLVGNVTAIRKDRGIKYLLGLEHAKQYNPSHVMFFDADDFVSRRLAAFVGKHKDSFGWYLDKGYLWASKRRYCYYVSNAFDAMCGTCYIVRADLYDSSANLSGRNQDFVEKLLGSHRYIKEHLTGNNTPVTSLPFPGAVYHVGHGENWTPSSISSPYRHVYPKIELNLRHLLSIKNYRPLTRQLRREFTLT